MIDQRSDFGTAALETREFQALTRKLLHLMVHSVYTRRDVFLRELISNASDALDKRHLASLRGDVAVDADPHIRLEIDAAARTLSIVDNGIGMTRDDVVCMIGTIARSGTAELAARQADAASFIGQFGIGFYSSFMVADQVTVVTRHAGGGPATRWTSDGGTAYTLETVADEVPAGTRVCLHLRPNVPALDAYLTELEIRQLVKRYSDFIAYPIRMHSDMVDEDVVLNSMRALWSRPPGEIRADEYHEFYQHLTHDHGDPLKTIHFHAEGRFEFDALLYVPPQAPFDLFAKDGKHGLQLFVRRVFVMEECRALLPGYLRWIKGVVDAHDLALNVSRETLAQNQQVQLIRRHLVRKILAALTEMRKHDRERYEAWWRQCGRKFKEGLKKHPEDREQLLELCLFESTASDGGLTTLDEYVARMPASQTAVYYISAESRARALGAPQLEALRRAGYEVVLLVDAVDELWIVDVSKFRDVPVQSARRGNEDLGIARSAVRTADFDGLVEWMRADLGDLVKDVRLSTRLVDSPACLVGDVGDITPHLEKMARSTGHDLPYIKRVFEINPTHEVIRQMQRIHRERGADPLLSLMARVLHGAASVSDGATLADPAAFGRQITDLLRRVASSQADSASTAAQTFGS